MAKKTTPTTQPSGTGSLVFPTGSPTPNSPNAAPAAPTGGSTGSLNLGAATGTGDIWNSGSVSTAQTEGQIISLTGPRGDVLGLGALFAPYLPKNSSADEAYVAAVAKMTSAQRQQLAGVLVDAGIVGAKTKPFTTAEVQGALSSALRQTQQAQNDQGQLPTLTGYLDTQITQQQTATGAAAGAQAKAGVNDLVTGLQSIADGYLLPTSPTALANQATQYLNSGLSITEAEANFKAQMQQQAAGLYPEFAPQILAGIDTKTLLSPYANLAEKTVGVDPATINWQAPNYASALAGPVDPKTGRSGVASLSQFSQRLMQDPSFNYQNTQEAQNAAGSLTASLLKLFGQIPNETLSKS